MPRPLNSIGCDPELGGVAEGKGAIEEQRLEEPNWSKLKLEERIEREEEEGEQRKVRWWESRRRGEERRKIVEEGQRKDR